jgi:hypothetical protein
MKLRAALIGSVFVALAGCSGGSGDTSSSIASEPTSAGSTTANSQVSEVEQGAAFTFAEDDLCDWITVDEVAEFFASEYEWVGTAELVNTADTGPDECRWRLTIAGADDYFEVSAGNADPGVLVPYDEIVEYDGEGVPVPGGTVSGLPSLSEGVVLQSAGWGVYSFWVPPRDEYLSLFVNRHSSDGSEVTGVDSSPDEEIRLEEQNRFFAFADHLLQELGWVP